MVQSQPVSALAQRRSAVGGSLSPTLPGRLDSSLKINGEYFTVEVLRVVQEAWDPAISGKT